MDGAEDVARRRPEKPISRKHEQLVADQVEHAVAEDEHVKVLFLPPAAPVSAAAGASRAIHLYKGLKLSAASRRASSPMMERPAKLDAASEF